VQEGPRTFFTTEAMRKARAGCSSHRGPIWIHQDKENEDFAFAVYRQDAAGEWWALAGVCDGVTQSPWSDRGAFHAAAAFIETVTERLRESTGLDTEMQHVDVRGEFARHYHRRLRERLDGDGQELQALRVPDPKFDANLYRRVFLDAPDALGRAKWFQTTILASALGPHGGFALLMGDGYLRVDRTYGDEAVKRPVALQGDPSKPERFISTSLTADDVLDGIRGIPPEGATNIGVVVATDGVEKSPEHGLDDAKFTTKDDCESFLEALANRPDKTKVDSDNMSVAFAWRELVS
jgi:hypothetical protein